MSIPARETVILALFALLNSKLLATNAGPFATVQRGLILPANVSFAKLAQPILCLYKSPGISEQFEKTGRGIPPRRTWEYWLAVYCTLPNGTFGWDQIYDPLADAIEDALAPDLLPDNRLTLGGLVDDCRLQGDVAIGNGDTDPKGQGFAVLPLRIIVP